LEIKNTGLTQLSQHSAGAWHWEPYHYVKS